MCVCVLDSTGISEVGHRLGEATGPGVPHRDHAGTRLPGANPGHQRDGGGPATSGGPALHQGNGTALDHSVVLADIIHHFTFLPAVSCPLVSGTIYLSL